MFARNAIEIFCSRWQGLSFLCLFGAVHLAIALDCVWGERWARGYTGDFGDLFLWASAAGMLPFSAGQAFFSAVTLYQGAFQSPRKARNTVRCWLAFNAVCEAIATVADIVQAASGQHAPGYARGRTFAIGNEALSHIALSITYSLYLITLRVREETFVMVFFLTGFGAACILATALSQFALIAALLLVVLVVVTTTRFLTVRAAWKRQATFRAVCEGFEDALTHDDAGRRSMEALCQEVEKELEAQFVAARAVVPWWRRIMQTRDVGFGRFAPPGGHPRVPGKIRQQTCDLGQLMSEAAAVDDAMYTLFERLLQPLQRHGQPEVVRAPLKKLQRAMEKCVRVYSRDARCLTDLARCCIVAQDFSQMDEVLRMFLRHSSVGLEPPRAHRARAIFKEAVHQPSSSGAGPQGGGHVYFRLTQCKNRFWPQSAHHTATGLRAVVLNLEMGWKEVAGRAVVVPVAAWADPETRQHIVEVQMLLRWSREMMETHQHHAAYRQWRDLMAC